MQLTVRLIDAKLRGYITPEEYVRRVTIEKLNQNSKVTIKVPDEDEF